MDATTRVRVVKGPRKLVKETTGDSTNTKRDCLAGGIMRTPEGKVKDKVKEFLHSRKVQSLTHPIEGAVGFYWMPVVGGMGSPFLDFVICYRGQFFGVETKATGVPTPRQKLIGKMVWQGYGIYEWGDDISLIPALTEWFDAWDTHPISGPPR